MAFLNKLTTIRKRHRLVMVSTSPGWRRRSPSGRRWRRADRYLSRERRIALNGDRPSVKSRRMLPPSWRSLLTEKIQPILLIVTSPKQPSMAKRDWYPYYAGYTESFVQTVLATDLRGVRSVLDPWSGSGTTTAACAKSGLRSVGIDVNPALTVIARARLTPRSTGESLLPLGRQILEAARDREIQIGSTDLLTRWMRPTAAARVRAIQESIHLLLTDHDCWRLDHGVIDRAANLPLLACFFYSALFAAVRDLLLRFRTTNPTWLTEPMTHRQRIATNWDGLTSAFLDRVIYLRDRLSLRDDEPSLEGSGYLTASATDQPFPSGTFEAALTSPPYATRIDYVKGTLPELIVLGASDAFLVELRRTTTGSPVVTENKQSALDSTSSRFGSLLLKRIAAHPSKGSAGYYVPWMRNYLLALQRGLEETSRSVVNTGYIGIVVQDSFYKEERIDLQRIVVEMMGAAGRRLVKQSDYPAKALRSHMNPKARRHLSLRRNCESFLIFQ